MATSLRLPSDWQPTNADREYGHHLALTDQQIDAIAEDMRLWAEANANRPVAKKASWSSAFKGWMRREAPKLRKNNGYGGSRLQGNGSRGRISFGDIADAAENYLKNNASPGQQNYDDIGGPFGAYINGQK